MPYPHTFAEQREILMQERQVEEMRDTLSLLVFMADLEQFGRPMNEASRQFEKKTFNVNFGNYPAPELTA